MMRYRPGFAVLAGIVACVVTVCPAWAQRPGTASREHDPAQFRQWQEQTQMRAAMARLHAHPRTSQNGNGGTIKTIAGSAPFQSPIQALQAGLAEPNGIATDKAGNIYLSIPEFRVVLKVDTSSNVSIYAGQALGPGPFQQSGDGGPATGATLVYPEGLAFDSKGNLYIADEGSSTIRVVSASTGTISTVAGTPGQYGHTGDGGPALSAELDGPTSVALDTQGNLYFGETKYLRKVNLQSGVISSIAGGATYSQACALSSTQNCAGDALLLAFSASSALVAGPNSLYVSLETASPGTAYFSKVVTVSYQTGQVQLIAGGGNSPDGPVIGSTAANSTFLFPAQIALDSAGNLDIAIDTVLLQLPNGGSTLTTLAGTINDFGYAGDSGPATSALLSVLGGITISPSGAILVADWTRIRSISGGEITTVAGDGTFNFYGDGGPATQAGLSQPEDTAFDGSGNLYIADVGNNTVRRVDAVTGAITTVWRTPVYDSNFSFETGLHLLYDIVADDATHLFISSSDGIEVLDLTTGDTTMVGGVDGAGQLNFDGNHTLAIESFDRLSTLDTITGQISQITPQIGGSFYGVAIDGSGNVYYSTPCAVWMQNTSTRAFSEVAGGQGIDGCSSVGGNLANDTALYFPGLLHLDGAGHLLFAEEDPFSYEGGHIDSVDLSAGTITTIGGSGVSGFSGDGGDASAADFNMPNSVNVDASGNYYIADTGNDRVRKIAPIPPSYTVTAAPASLSIAQGNTGTAVLTVTPAGGFHQAVTFSCGTGLPTGVSCTFSPASVTPTGTAAVTTTLTVTTTGATEAALAPMHPAARWWLSGGAASLACLLLTGLSGARRRSRSLWLGLVVCVLGMGVSVVGGCGSGGSGGGGTTNPNATPPGTYTLNLVAAAGSGTTAQSVPLKFSLTVTN